MENTVQEWSLTVFNSTLSHKETVKLSLPNHTTSSYSQQTKSKERACGPSDTHNEYYMFVIVTPISAVWSQRKSNTSYMGCHQALYLTSYHLSLYITFLSPSKSTAEHNITSALMKISFKALLKGWLYQHLLFCAVHSRWGPTIAVASWHVVSSGFTKKNVPRVQLLMCLLGRVIRGRWQCHRVTTLSFHLCSFRPYWRAAECDTV